MTKDSLHLLNRSSPVWKDKGKAFLNLAYNPVASPVAIGYRLRILFSKAIEGVSPKVE